MSPSHKPGISCPRCRFSASFHPVEMQEDSTGCLMFMLGGFLPYLLYNSSRQGRVQCAKCGFIFRVPRPLGGLEFAILFVIVAGTIAAAVYILFASSRG